MNSGLIEQLALARKLLDDAPVPTDNRMSMPELWMSPETNTAVQVRAAFEKALSPDCFAEIAEVSCGYELISDSVQFLITRRRDGMKVMLPIRREQLTEAEVDNAVGALRADQEMFARLVLFLA